MKLRYKRGKYISPEMFAYFPVKYPIKINIWESLRRVALNYPPNVLRRLEWVIFYETIANKDAAYTARYFAISRKTFHKWYKLFKLSHHNLNSLMDRSKAPRKKRSWMVTPLEEDRVYSLRKKYLRYGKKKIKRLYLRFYGEDISTWKIERVIRKHKLYSDPVKNRRIVKYPIICNRILGI